MSEARWVNTDGRFGPGHGLGIRLPQSTTDREEDAAEVEVSKAKDARGATSDTQDRVAVPAPPSWQDRVLRACDFIVAAFALVALSPVLLAIAVAIKLDSDGPVLYRQLRIGVDRRRGRVDDDGGRRTDDLGGEPFLMYKFRTMRVDAERESGPVWADREDDRVTRIGRFLRQHRLDELPQFWNVLKGDMSVVGPRPERPILVRHLRREISSYQIRQRVRPGITGWAQVNREPDRTVDDVRSKLRYDLEYLEKRSIAFDFRIMARTVPVMLEGHLLEEESRKGSNGKEGETDPDDGARFPRGATTS